MKERFETFTVLINRISRNIKKIENQEMTEYNLRSSHISCLYHLYLCKNLTSTQLCERCEEDKATISRSIHFLEKEGYLTCDSKGIKRYNSPLVLTAKGKEAGKKIADKIGYVLKSFDNDLTEEERIAFYKSLSVISDSIEKISNASIEKLLKG